MTVLPIKHAFRTVVGGVWGEEAENNDQDVRCVRVADFDYTSLAVGDRNVTYRSVAPSQLSRRLLAPGDIVIEKSGGGENTIVGRAVQWNHSTRAVTSNFMARLEPQPDHHGKYLTYVLAHLYSTGVVRRYIKQTTGIQNLDLPAFLQEKWDFPSRDKQDAIAAFLDHETARIDALVREQELLLEDLAEKRRSTITAAVTAGIRPQLAQRTDIPWMPLIPQHWKVIPLKHLLKSLDQGWSPECENRQAEPGEWGVLKLSAVTSGRFLPEEHKTLPADEDPDPRLTLQAGDVLVTRANTRSLVGATALVAADQTMLMMSDLIYRLRTIPDLYSPAFLTAVLQSAVGRAVIELNANGTSHSMVKIPQRVLLNMPVPVPPRQEQDEIIEHIDHVLAQIDTLAAEVRANIEDMKLLRSTLITAATTGKIDVRGWRRT